ncbi:MAG: LON peptidase substrate-binding domain-containing protein, partial [Mycoplasmoidaceae bacterium]|nr:LON peptidase substrate-binding domain-containing protein [Mycoplasmoidaceae bacterium]
RINLLKVSEKDNTLFADYEVLKETNSSSADTAGKIKELFTAISANRSELNDEDFKKLKAIFEGSKSFSTTKIVDTVASFLPIGITKKQQILEELDVTKRISLILTYCVNPDQMVKIDREINKKINDTLSKQQKEFYLREKLRVVKEELGEISSKENDVNNLRKKVMDNPYPQHIKDRVISEINRIEAGNNPQESAINRAYVE